MSAIDQVLAFVKVIASELIAGEPTFNVTGIGDIRAEGLGFAGDDGDDAGEQAAGQVAYGPLGILGRPLPPEGPLYAEALAARVDGGLSPIAWRDMRINNAVNPGAPGTPALGQLMFAGYGGAFLSHALTAAAVGSRKANISTWYVPFDFDAGGVPAKAHVISIDPTPGNSSISLVHADGVFFSLTSDGITWAVDNATFGSIKAGEVLIQASRIMLKGNCYLGAQPEVGAPLLGGPISPPSPSIFVSPV